MVLLFHFSSFSVRCERLRVLVLGRTFYVSAFFAAVIQC